jgi:hypothetical protein
VQTDVLTTRALLGETVDAKAFAALSSTLVRLGSRLGLEYKHKPKPASAGVGLSDYLSGKASAPDVISGGQSAAAPEVAELDEPAAEPEDDAAPDDDGGDA